MMRTRLSALRGGGLVAVLAAAGAIALVAVAASPSVAAGTATPVYNDQIKFGTPLSLADPSSADPAYPWIADQLLVNGPAAGDTLPGCTPTALAAKDLTLCGRPAGSVTFEVPPAPVLTSDPSYQNGVLKISIGDPGIAGYTRSEQSQIEHYFPTGSEPTLSALLSSRPQYDAYTTTNGGFTAAQMKFRFSCPAAGFDGYFIQDTSSGAYTDSNGNGPTQNLWQTWQYPAPTDTTSPLEIFTNSGTNPYGVAAQNGVVNPAQLISGCPDGVVTAVALSDGRYAQGVEATTYVDNVSFLDTLYDFQARPTPPADDPAPTPTPTPTTHLPVVSG